MDAKRKAADFEVEFGGFEKLMPHRIKNILMVASLYDSFLLADDDRLNEALFGEMPDSGARAAPKITRVATAEKALEKLAGGAYDLVIAMIQVGETDMSEFKPGTKVNLEADILGKHVQRILEFGGGQNYRVSFENKQ